MGYGTRNNGQIKTFWPDDNDHEFYIDSYASLAYILDECKARWGKDVGLSKIEISSEYIHTDCLTYDKYDPGDYTKFICVSYIKD